MNPEIRQQFQQLDEARKQLMNKRSEMDQEIKEHDLVLGAFSKVEEGRKCYRMVGGVLMERTVGEVGPALEYEFVFSVIIFVLYICIEACTVFFKWVTRGNFGIFSDLEESYASLASRYK